tara:strand:- start:1041 stop:1520 length:480 start_codon:yes stop_codon:yes gene_type:complete
MVLSVEEKKQRNIERTRKWRAENPEKHKEQNARYYQKHREKKLAQIKKSQAKIREENPNFFAQKSAAYYQKNKPKMLAKAKEYKSTEHGYKVTLTSSWNFRGLKGDLDMIYRIYKSTKFCDDCACELDTHTFTKKCMDHCHKSGGFRGVVCVRCNNRRG